MTAAEFEQMIGAYQGLGVLARADLARFCHADTTTHAIGDPQSIYVLEGRRQVWLRINDFITKPSDELMRKYTRPASEER